MKKEYAEPTAEMQLFGAGDAVLNSTTVSGDEDFGYWPDEWGN